MLSSVMNRIVCTLSLTLFFTYIPVLHSEQFRLAHKEYLWSFPKDHGAHRDFQTEWWYFTGALYKSDKQGAPFLSGPDYGFQLTFFRRATDLQTHSYLAHGALSDITAASFNSAQISSSELSGLAAAKSDRLDIYLQSWSAQSAGDKIILKYNLPEGTELRLVLTPKMNPWLQSESGFSLKGNCSSGCASMYYSIPSLEIEGEIINKDQRTPVRGIGWFDHEFMTNALAKDQVGWDWFSIMQKDGTNIMLFVLRHKDGSIDFASGGVLKGSKVAVLKKEHFSITPKTYWISPKTKARYPIAWDIKITGLESQQSLSLELAALIADQEHSHPNQNTPTYWEGIISSKDGNSIGYAEMTGYAGALSGDF